MYCSFIRSVKGHPPLQRLLATYCKSNAYIKNISKNHITVWTKTRLPTWKIKNDNLNRSFTNTLISSQEHRQFPGDFWKSRRDTTVNIFKGMLLQKPGVFLTHTLSIMAFLFLRAQNFRNWKHFLYNCICSLHSRIWL